MSFVLTKKTEIDQMNAENSSIAADKNGNNADNEKILTESMNCSKNVTLICQSLLLLSQKRRTLEEKAIIAYFNELAIVNAKIIELLHSCISNSRSLGQSTDEILGKLQTVNENVCSRIEELLKILNYNFNFLEQYFEYDYCAKLLEKKELQELEKIKLNLSNSLL